jgi:hypothetical protein
MLTKEQIEQARAQRDETVLCPPEMHCAGCDVVRTVFVALAAYERVKAWVDGGALAAVTNSPHLTPEVCEAVKGCRDDVLRALEG